MSRTNGTANRETFARIRSVRDYPDFLDVQLQSFREFTQDHIAADERSDKFGLQAVFR